jgi:hypothetical protein
MQFRTEAGKICRAIGKQIRFIPTLTFVKGGFEQNV